MIQLCRELRNVLSHEIVDVVFGDDDRAVVEVAGEHVNAGLLVVAGDGHTGKAVLRVVVSLQQQDAEVRGGGRFVDERGVDLALLDVFEGEAFTSWKIPARKILMWILK